MLWSSMTDSTVHSFDGTTHNNPIFLESIPHLHNVTTEDTLLRQKQDESMRPASSPKHPSLFRRIFTIHHKTVLPLFYRNTTETTTTVKDRSATVSLSPGVHAHAWASEICAVERVSDADGVHVIHELHQNCCERDESEKEKNTVEAWV
jgi:pheromone a factor receptor